MRALSGKTRPRGGCHVSPNAERPPAARAGQRLAYTSTTKTPCACDSLALTLWALPHPGMLVEWSNELEQAHTVAPDRLNIVKRCVSPSRSTPLRSVPSSQAVRICPDSPLTKFTIANLAFESMSHRENNLSPLIVGVAQMCNRKTPRIG